MQIGQFLNFRKWAEVTLSHLSSLPRFCCQIGLASFPVFINRLMATWFLLPRASLTLSVNRRIFSDVYIVSTQRKPKQFHHDMSTTIIHFLHLAGHLPSRSLGMLLAIITAQNINPNYATSIYPNIHTSFCGIDYISNYVYRLFCAKKSARCST